MKKKDRELVKLNMGSASKRLDGYLNVDIRKAENVDIILDLTSVPYEENFAVADQWILAEIPKHDWTNWVDEITAQEILEHISFREIGKVLVEWHRILKSGGVLNIQVPDIGKMCEYYVNKQICECVPHKAKDWKSFSAIARCPRCGGEAKVNPDRWKFALHGAGKHEYDWHKNHFTKESLKELLLKVGFQDIKFEDNIYKLMCSCRKGDK